MKRSVLIGVLAMGLLHVYAQDDFKSEYEKFRQQSVTKYDNFRLEANRQYAEFMRNAWEEYKKLPAIPKPKEKEVPPVVKPKKDEGKPIDCKPVKIDDEVVTGQRLNRSLHLWNRYVNSLLQSQENYRFHG